MQKKEYKAPRLEYLGDISDFTRNGGLGNNIDGAYDEKSDNPFDMFGS